MIQERRHVLRRTLKDFTILLCEHMAAPRWAAAVVFQKNNAALDKRDGKSSDRHARPRADQARRAGPQDAHSTGSSGGAVLPGRPLVPAAADACYLGRRPDPLRD